MLTQDINVIIPLNREFESLHQPIESFKGSYIATSTLSSPTEHCRKHQPQITFIIICHVLNKEKRRRADRD